MLLSLRLTRDIYIYINNGTRRVYVSFKQTGFYRKRMVGNFLCCLYMFFEQINQDI